MISSTGALQVFQLFVVQVDEQDEPFRMNIPAPELVQIRTPGQSTIEPPGQLSNNPVLVPDRKHVQNQIGRFRPTLEHFLMLAAHLLQNVVTVFHEIAPNRRREPEVSGGQ